MKIFGAADILLPKTADMNQWAVIACDQFTSDAAYWQRVRALAGDKLSTIHMILPEAELGRVNEADAIASITAAAHSGALQDAVTPNRSQASLKRVAYAF